MAKVRVHAVVSGLVQGVCFRAWTAEKAEALNVSGWVRNLPGGEVEVLMEGEAKDVQELVSALHEGPPQARVLEVKTEKEAYKGDFHDFLIERGAKY